MERVVYMLEILPTMLVAIVIPVTAFLANLILRSKYGVMQSAGADALLVLIVFDFTVVADAVPFARIPRTSEIAAHLNVIFAMYAAIVFLVWLVAVTSAENEITLNFDRQTRRYNPKFPTGIFLLCWVGTVGIIAVHVVTLLW